ncbi:uncharacterized protein C20orf204 homolog [Grammomys surdaster]|uniref:uncharacterized protein C20orf204 homolog n=1 Tax=Grammomys surdaster TaxID=491861 RepID=UPI00109F2835|nr:uncharacterized protein C20orf204 homolog [Grammomys surdaster]
MGLETQISKTQRSPRSAATSSCCAPGSALFREDPSASRGPGVAASCLLHLPPKDSEDPRIIYVWPARGSKGRPDPERPMDLQAAMQWAGLGVQRTEPGTRHHRFIQRNLTGAGRGQGQPGTSCGTQKIQQPKKQTVQPRSSRRRLLLRALYAVATCWEKLFALSAMATREF